MNPFVVVHPTHILMHPRVHRAGTQTRGGIWGIFPPPKISKHYIAILTFAETFKE